MSNSSRRPRRSKHQSAKPRSDFPLTAHPSGRWCKKIKGKLHYFGPIIANDNGASAQAALDKWLHDKDELLAGRVPRQHHANERRTLRYLCDMFIITKEKLRDAGELSMHSWRDYYAVCESLIATFGRDRLLTDILPEDFERLRTKWADRWGPVRLGNEINRVRIVFNYAYKNGLIDRPMRYGEGFKRPSKKTLRLERAKKGIRMFEADELRRIINMASQPMKAMILLGINAGLGNADVGTLPMKALDVDKALLDFPRPKTGIARKCPLWTETVEAIKEWLTQRPTPKDEAHADLVFITARRDSWAKETSDNPISKEMRKLLDKININGNRNFYALRHTFETMAGESKDQVAVDFIMGHVDNSMSAAYRERISDERLRAVVNRVHAWLFNITAADDTGNAAQHRHGNPAATPNKSAKGERPKLRIVSFDEDPLLSA
jgi:integrase